MLAAAQETCTKIYDDGNESSWSEKALSYTQGQDLFLDKAKFTSAQPGNRIKIYGFLTSGGAHKLYLGEYDPNRHLPGSDYRSINALSGENPVYFYLTEDMLKAIVTDGKDLRIFGEGITVNRVDLCTGKARGLHEAFRTIWTGFYWMDSWSTLELYKEAFTAVDLSQYQAIRFYHEAGRTDYTLNIFCVNDGLGLSAPLVTAEHIHKNATCADVLLTDAVRTALGNLTTALYIQMDKGAGSAFNFTDIVLIPKHVDGCDNCFFVTY